MTTASEKQVGFACVLMRQKGLDPKAPAPENDYGIPAGTIANDWLPEQDKETVSGIIDTLKVDQ